jgi:hypothetical protein
VYFGGASNIEGATPLAVEAGTQARADFKLRLEPTYKIRGFLENFSPGERIVFELLEGDDNVAASRVSVNAANGRYEIDDVPAGQYNVRATQQVSWGEVRVTVNDGDASGVSIKLAPGVSVKGILHIDGPLTETGDPQSPQQVGRGAVGNTFCKVSLQPAGQKFPLMGMGYPGNPEFTIPNVFPGTYPVRLSCHGGYIVSAVSGSSDLLAEPVLSVPSGTPPPPIEITMKPGGGAVHGKLTVPSSGSSPTILLVPTFPSTGPVTVWSMEDENETLEFRGDHLAPGDYVAYALADAAGIEYRNPAVLRSLTSGASVRIEDNKTAEITLTSEVK